MQKNKVSNSTLQHYFNNSTSDDIAIKVEQVSKKYCKRRLIELNKNRLKCVRFLVM